MYYWYHLATQMLRPVNQLAKISHKLLQTSLQNHPGARFLKIADAQSILMERDTREYSRPSFGIEHTLIQGIPVPIDEVIVAKSPFCNLKFFAKKASVNQEKLLIIAPLSGHFATLLRDTVSALLPYYDIYITEWVNARDIPRAYGPFHLSDYIELIVNWLEGFQEKIHVLGVCQPTVPLIAGTIALEKKNSPYTPRSLILIGGPVDTRVAPSKVNTYAKSLNLRWFEKNVVDYVPFPYAGAGRKVCPGFVMLNGFMSLDPKRHLGSHLKFYESLMEGSGEEISTHTKFYDEYRAVMDLPGEYIIDTLDHVFQRHLLPQGEFTWKGEVLDPRDLKTPAILSIEGERDNISPPGQTSAIHELTPKIAKKLKVAHVQEGAGHYGIFSGRTWRSKVVPLIQWFTENVVVKTQ